MLSINSSQVVTGSPVKPGDDDEIEALISRRRLSDCARAVATAPCGGKSNGATQVNRSSLEATTEA